MYGGERFSFRIVEESDLDFLADHRNQEETWSNLTSALPVHKERQGEWLASLGGDKYYFIGLNYQSPVAFLRLTDIDWVNRSAAVGIDVFKGYREQGISTSMFKLLVDYCFEVLNLHRVWLLVLSTNETAIHVYEGAGFQHEGALRQAIYRNGEYVDYLLMGLLKEERLDPAV